MSGRNLERLLRTVEVIEAMVTPRHEGCKLVEDIIAGVPLKEAVDEFVKTPPETLEKLLPIDDPESLIEVRPKNQKSAFQKSSQNPEV